MQDPDQYDGIMVDRRSKPSADLDLQGFYEIRVLGTLDNRWSEWFNGCEITIETSGAYAAYTKISCPQLDQAGLRGLLNRIWDLILNLISVHQIPDPTLKGKAWGGR